MSFQEKFYQHFHTQFSHLQDAHVRALAWMLISPNLIDSYSPIWWQSVGRVPLPSLDVLKKWLGEVDAYPQALHESLHVHQFTRLGRYAESLLEFYFKHFGLQYACNVQVHSAEHETLGEFDFLLYESAYLDSNLMQRKPALQREESHHLVHVELAMKFYLFYAGSFAHRPSIYYYLGPNLKDNFGKKMHKILFKQLTLPQLESAKKVIPTHYEITQSKILLRGWMFYHPSEMEKYANCGVEGMTSNHCQGYWWKQSELQDMTLPSAQLLERLQWCAPAQVNTMQADSLLLDKASLLERIERHFHVDDTPVLIALMQQHGDLYQEYQRGFVVKDDWDIKAQQMLSQEM